MNAHPQAQVHQPYQQHVTPGVNGQTASGQPAYSAQGFNGAQTQAPLNHAGQPAQGKPVQGQPVQGQPVQGKPVHTAVVVQTAPKQANKPTDQHQHKHQHGSNGALIGIYLFAWFANLTGAIISIMAIVSAQDLYGDLFGASYVAPSDLSIGFNLIMLYNPFTWIMVLLGLYLTVEAGMNAQSIKISQIVGLILQLITSTVGICNYTQLNSITGCDMDTNECKFANIHSAYQDSLLILTIVPLVLFIGSQVVVSTMKHPKHDHSKNEKGKNEQKQQQFNPADPFGSIHPPDAPPAPDAAVSKLISSQVQGGNTGRPVGNGVNQNASQLNQSNHAGNTSAHNGSHAPLNGQKPLELNDIDVNHKGNNTKRDQHDPLVNQYQQQGTMKSSMRQDDGQYSGQKKQTTFEDPFNKHSGVALGNHPPLIDSQDPYMDNMLDQVQKMVNSQVQGLIVDLKKQKKM